jgi:hypothetical protein
MDMSNSIEILVRSAKHIIENDDSLKALRIAKVGRKIMNGVEVSEEELISLGIIKGEEVPTYESEDYKN